MKKILVQAAKIGIGSSVAIIIASFLGLEQISAAGTIALLTLMTTKWGSVWLSLYRVLSYWITVIIAWTVFTWVDDGWIGYGVFLFVTVIVAELLNWRSTISVNSVIGVHFLLGDFTAGFIWNEFMLVLIGIVIALILNLFNDNFNRKKHMIADMRYTERTLQMVLEELAMYLFNTRMQRNVWEDLKGLENDLHKFIREACEYQDNTFYSHPGYYIDYFEMRLQQCTILHNLHSELRRMRHMPAQAEKIAGYLLYLKDYVVECNAPEEQIRRLEKTIEELGQEALPVSREEFESRAVLYHVLMDIEDFLIVKKRFVDELDDLKLRKYWDADHEKRITEKEIEKIGQER